MADRSESLAGDGRFGGAPALLALAGGLEQRMPAATLGARIAELTRIPCSLTGPGVRRTLDVLAEWAGSAAMVRHEVPSGTPVLDWTVPDEWTLRRATVRRTTGEVLIDTDEHPLHVIGYSEPFSGRVRAAELLSRLVTLPERPNAIPYRTAYYRRTWGFCTRHADLARFRDEEYLVDIDADLGPGRLSYGEIVLPGSVEDEVLIVTHTCHPAMANDNAAGMAVVAALAELLAGVARRLTFRVVFAPGTIGAITWLATHAEVLPRIRHGIVVNNAADRSPLTWKRSRRGSLAGTRTDTIAEMVLGRFDPEARFVDFHPYGYDERQYCSPGFDLPVGALSRAEHGSYPEYHTSDDNLTFVSPAHALATLEALLRVCAAFEGDVVLTNRSPFGEPQLGRRGLYGAIGGATDTKAWEMALLWVLSQADGTASPIDVAHRSGLEVELVLRACAALADVELLDIGGAPGGSGR